MCDFGKIFRNFRFCSQNFSAVTISSGKFFGFSNFRAKIFWIRPTFDWKFFGFFKFRTEKNSQNLRLGRFCYNRFTAGSESVAELTPFFPTFAANIFGIFNFQPENFPFFNFRAEIFRPGNFQSKKIRAAGISARACRARSVARECMPADGPSVDWIVWVFSVFAVAAGNFWV